MKHIFLLFITFFLSGCWLTAQNSTLPWGASPLGFWAVGESVSYLATGKIMEDNIASVWTGKDCSLSRKLKGEGKYCLTDIELEQANRPVWSVQKVYCYKSLATPTCYTTPSPNPADILMGVYDKPVYPTPEYY